MLPKPVIDSVASTRRRIDLTRASSGLLWVGNAQTCLRSHPRVKNRVNNPESLRGLELRNRSHRFMTCFVLMKSAVQNSDTPIYGASLRNPDKEALSHIFDENSPRRRCPLA